MPDEIIPPSIEPDKSLEKKNPVLKRALPLILSLLSVIVAASQNARINSGIV